MTSQEAVKILKGAIKKPNTKDGYLGQAIDLAIKALEQQPCEDCISRAEALRRSHIEYDDDGEGHRVVYVEDIEELPSVTPKQKVGKWTCTDDMDEWYGKLFRCSVCGAKVLEVDRYCPYCGAKMEVSDDT